MPSSKPASLTLETRQAIYHELFAWLALDCCTRHNQKEALEFVRLQRETNTDPRGVYVEPWKNYSIARDPKSGREVKIAFDDTSKGLLALLDRWLAAHQPERQQIAPKRPARRPARIKTH